MPRRGRPRKRPFQSLYLVRDYIEYTSDSDSDFNNIQYGNDTDGSARQRQDRDRLQPEVPQQRQRLAEIPTQQPAQAAQVPPQAAQVPPQQPVQPAQVPPQAAEVPPQQPAELPPVLDAMEVEVSLKF